MHLYESSRILQCEIQAQLVTRGTGWRVVWRENRGVELV
jgi:hypothetical protein